MQIMRVHIEGFKRFTHFELDLNPTFNVIVGDNETGKSSVLDAIGLVLTGQYDGRLVQYAIDPYIFNAQDVADFFQKLRNKQHRSPPRVLIEAYLKSDAHDPALSALKGTNNTKNEDCPGLKVEIDIDHDHIESLKTYVSDNSNPSVLPVEFYKATWRAFDNNNMTLRKLPFRAATIDTSLTRTHRGPNKYVSQIVSDVLSEDQRRELSLAYKRLRHGFTQEEGVATINKHLEQQGNIVTTKKLTVQMDMSSRTTWDSAITAHMDDLPFDCAGKGEQCRVQMRLAIAGTSQSRVLLVEEPENHLSHSKLNMLMEDIQKDCADRQVIITTHSAFVLNKLGIDNLRLISHDGKTAALMELASETKDYFMKLPGYDTLRLILSKRCILVEGPSDELIVQRAYRDKYGKLPLEDGIDVFSIGALAFNRFLEIAERLNLDVRVVTDNDGDVQALKTKYAPYLDGGGSKVRICYDTDETCQTLESQLLKSNSLDTLNAILGKKFTENYTLLKYMKNNKTDCALKFFEAKQTWNAPAYIANALQ